MKVILINLLLKMQITLECEDTLKAKRNLANEAVKIASKHTSSADNHSAYWVRLRDYHDISDFLDITERFDMKISEIGAKVITVGFFVVQSQRYGGFFFLSTYYTFETKNLLSCYSFMSIISSHSRRFGHSIHLTK